MRRQSSQPSLDGVTSATVSRCPHVSSTPVIVARLGRPRGTRRGRGSRAPSSGAASRAGEEKLCCRHGRDGRSSRATAATAAGYLVVPDAGPAPGVLVHPGVVGHSTPGSRRWPSGSGDAGFVALVPDLYHGELAEHTEMDKAARAHDGAAPGPCRARHERRGRLPRRAPRGRRRRPRRRRLLHGRACSRSSSPPTRGDQIDAAAPFYGFPSGERRARLVDLTAPVRGHMAEHDDFFPPDAIARARVRSCAGWART